jgi:DNA polymerase III delta prime subunit
MKINDLNIGTAYVVNLISPMVKADWTGHRRYKNFPCSIMENQGDLYLRLGSEMIPVSGKEKEDQNKIQQYLRDRNRALAMLVHVSDNQMVLEYRILSQAYSFPEKIEFGLRDIIEEDIRKRFDWGRGDLSDMLSRLEKELIIEDEKYQQALLITQGPASTEVRKSFRILGKTVAVDVSRNQENQFEIDRIVKSGSARRDPVNPVILLKGIFEVKDITTTGLAREIVQLEIKTIVTSGDCYIKLWEEYNQLERADVLAKVQELGSIYIARTAWEPSQNAFKFFPKEEKDAVLEWVKAAMEQNQAIEFGAELPEYLKGNSESKIIRGKERRMVFTIVGNSQFDNSILIRILNQENPELPQSGFLFGSLLGDEIRLGRREKAAELIRKGESAMPNISLILEERAVPARESRKINAITPALKRKLRFPLNTKQEQALELALNTPDIALIQGPPGTGKTQVISALCERLVEEAKNNNQDPSKMILLSAFQHDAVGNAALRTSVLGLPPLKVGRKSETLNQIASWTNETQSKIRAELSQWPEGSVRSLKKEVWKSRIFLRKSQPGDAEVKRELERLSSMLKGQVPIDVSEALQNVIGKLGGELPTGQGDAGTERLAKAIRGLRTEAISWEDDGLQRLTQAKLRLERASIVLGADPQKFIDRLEDLDEGQIPSAKDFEKLMAFKNQLLDQVSDLKKPVLPGGYLQETEEVFDFILEALEAKLLESEEGVPTVLQDYLEDMENDPKGIKAAIEAYSTILAATVQGSDSKKVHELKADGQSDFDTVIVDEAARANPLDLFIAISKGRRRIILVGDHRQLPHMLEPDLEKELMNTASEDFGEKAFEDAMKKSLFERLFRHLLKQEDIDHKKRTITLDQQYRMHPVIGDFVSNTFYERHYDTKIKSETEPASLVHKISEFGDAQVAWVEVPIELGQESGRQSKSRRKEAEILALHLAEAMQEAPDLSFGIITFYKEQVGEIMKACARLDTPLTEKNDRGEWEVTKPYRELEIPGGDIIERLRIGSVDAFQGKEFDVVFLSTVRSNDRVIIPDDSRSGLRKYGFLTLENRLNVAISRAKRLLVGVGDSAMFQLPEAKDYVHGLHAFYELTGGSDGIRID